VAMEVPKVSLKMRKPTKRQQSLIVWFINFLKRKSNIRS
jgi:hypothetical protein